MNADVRNGCSTRFQTHEKSMEHLLGQIIGGDKVIPPLDNMKDIIFKFYSWSRNNPELIRKLEKHPKWIRLHNSMKRKSPRIFL